MNALEYFILFVVSTVLAICFYASIYSGEKHFDEIKIEYNKCNGNNELE